MTDHTERNQKNSAHSTGPRTEPGKRRSRLNATRHSLTGQIVCHTAEDLAAFQSHCAAILAELAPAGAIETFFATSCAEDMWRLSRARALENGIFAQSDPTTVNTGLAEVDTALAQSRTWQEQAHSLHLLTVYEGRIRRNLDKNMEELRSLQSGRRAGHEYAAKQADSLVLHAESKGEIYEPAEDFEPASAHGGFVFSMPEVHRRRDLARRLNAAECHRLDVYSGRTARRDGPLAA